MIYLSFVEFTSHGEAEDDNTEGSLVVACEAASSKEVVDTILPTKLKAMEQEVAENGQYVEFYLQGVVELKLPLGAAVVLGFSEGELSKDRRSFADVIFGEDEEHVRAIRSVKINEDLPFLSFGKPPQRISDLADRG